MEKFMLLLECLCRRLYGFVWRLRIKLTTNLERRNVRKFKKRNTRT